MKNYKFYEKNMKKYVKAQEKNSKLKEKTENSRWKLKKSALLGSLDAGKASKKKACFIVTVRAAFRKPNINQFTNN